jgi:hypothetical protein
VTQISPSRKILIDKFWLLRQQWLESSNTEFEEQIEDFFDEFMDYMELNTGN